MAGLHSMLMYEEMASDEWADGCNSAYLVPCWFLEGLSSGRDRVGTQIAIDDGCGVYCCYVLYPTEPPEGRQRD